MARHRAPTRGAHAFTGVAVALVTVWVTQSTPAYAPPVMTFNPPMQHPIDGIIDQPDFIPHEFNPDARLDRMQVTLP